MGRQRINQENVQTIIKALLLSQGQAIYTGVPMAQLDNDYYHTEGMRIPFRRLGYSCLFDFLQTLTDTLTVKYKNRIPVVFPILDENSKEILAHSLQQVSRTNYSDVGPAGDTDNDSENDFVSHAASTTRDVKPASWQNNKKPQNNKRRNNKTSSHDDCHKKTMRDIVNDTVKQHLRDLISKYPDGIWCADLPTLYEEEYKVPLNYEELGIYSVLSFASYLPDVFHCIQPQDKGDYKLYDARVEKPTVQRNKKPVTTTFVASYNGLNDESPEPVPPLSMEIANRLIPDAVMKIGETVSQISVTELNQDPNDTIEVVVVEVFTPSFFWIQLRERMPHFELFMNKLHDFYEMSDVKYLIPPAIIAKGLNCACKYEEQWHRGIITNITDDRNATILFYDYGTLETYKPDAIHFLHRSFINPPAQAIPCGLYNIKPLGTAKWSTPVVMEFGHKVFAVPLVAMIAQIDTENNSMLIGLTDTSGTEDLHINDWLIDKGYAEYGKMGETVQLNDRVYDKPMETSSWESTVEAPERKRPGVTLSTIEEEAYSRSGNDSPVDNALAYSQFFNSKALLSITWCMADIKECKRRGIPLEPRVRSKLEGFKNFITTELAGCIVSEISTDDRSTSCTQVPEPKANDDLAVEPTVPSTSNYLSPTMITSESYTNVQSTPSNDLACDINMNVSAKLCTDDSTNTSAFPFASPKHENADDHVSNDVYKMKPTTNRSSPTIVSRYENSSIISSDHPVEEPTTMTVTPRMLFEKSLLQSANDFFRRMEITAKATPNLQSSNDELSCTNPFKKNIEKACKKHCSTSVTSHPSKNSLRRPHRATNAQIKNQPCEPSSTQIIYENGSVLYGLNVNLSIDNNSSRTMNESYANACEKRNVIDVQEWTGSTSSVSTGHSNVDNSKVVSPSLSRVEPPRVVNGNGDVPSLNAANWLKAIETAIDFKKEFITKQNNEIQNDPTSRLIENAITLNAKQHNEIKNNPTLRLMENATTQNDSSQLPNCWQIPLTSYTMHLIKHEGRGWLALHEFAAFINTSPKVIVESLSPENINESFCLIRRYDNIQLFEILDRSSLCVPRDRNNKIGHILDLMSLESVLQILRKLKLVTTEQIDKAKNGRICPDDSSLLRDVCILNAVSMECINLNAP